MAYDIGTARGVIEMQYNGRGMDQAKDDLAQLDDKGKKTGYSMEEASNRIGGVGVAIAAGLGIAVNSAANFEQRMSAIEAVSGATAGEMQQLSDKALDLGAKTSFSAGEAASAIEELVKAGLSVPEVMNGAADATVALAAAGEIALPEAATIASNALNQFNLEAEQLPKVADTIAGAANASAIGVSDLGQSMQQVGAVANLAGVSFEDTATAIALMGNAGIKGSDAGTSLKSMLSRLQPTTKKQADLFRELGITTEDGSNKFYTAEGNLKSFDKVAQVLQGSLEGMTKKQKQAALQTLFGSDAIRAAAIMANNGAKGFNKMNDAMGKTTAAEVAETRLDNFKGSLEAMMGSLETFGITIGTLLLPPLRQLVEALTGVVNWFSGLGSGTQTAIVAFLGFVAVALVVIATVMKIIIFVGKFRATLIALRGTMIATWLAALGPIALVIAAIAAIIAIIIILWKKSQTFRNIVMAVWNAVKAAWAGVKSATISAWNTVVNAVKSAITRTRATVSSVVAAIRSAISNAWNTVKTLTTTAWNAVVKIISTKIAEFIADVKRIKDQVTGALSGAKDWLFSKGQEIIQGLIDGVMSMVGKVTDAISNVTGAISKYIPGSPVKEGPLKVLNRGYAGQQIVKMVIDGMDKMATPMALAMDDVMPTPTVVSPTVTGRVKKKNGTRAPGGTLVRGALELVNGRAYISGIAEDVYDNFHDDNIRRG